MIKHEISQEQFENAIKRHEEAFQKELDEVDIRAVVLKTKKALIEQSMKNEAAYNAALDYDASMKQFKRTLDYQEKMIKDLEFQMKQNTLAFKAAVEIMAMEKEEEKQKQIENNKGFLTKFWEFIKCLAR